MKDGARLCTFMTELIKNSDATATDTNGSNVEVEVCTVTVVHEA